MRILFIGSKDRGVRCLEALIEDNQNIVGVVSEEKHDDNAFWTGSVINVAKSHGLETQSPDDINSEVFVSKLRDLNPDLITMAGYSQILRSEVISIPDEGVINLHAGKLPKYRGGSPMNWAIINGEESGTATIHKVTEQIDAGSILAEKRFEIGIDDTIADVRNRTLDIFPELLVEVVTQIQRGELDPKQNDITNGAYWGSRTPEDGQLDFARMTAKGVYDKVRALTHPYPGAFVTYEGQRLFIWEAELMNEEVNHEPGRVCMQRGDSQVVAAEDRGILLKTVQLEGREEIAAGKILERGGYLQ